MNKQEFKNLFIKKGSEVFNSSCENEIKDLLNELQEEGFIEEVIENRRHGLCESTREFRLADKSIQDKAIDILKAK